jgi:phospholipid/cholesterol/gamma-HCH transport system substrate-binding protein
MASNDTKRNLRIGVLVSTGLLMLMMFLFFIGSEQKLFSRKNEYKVRLDSVSGLAQGNPVQMSGVTIGTVRDIHLPRNPKNEAVEIAIHVDRKFEDRIRLDSRARMKKLGLIAADSYIEISPGSPELPALAPGSLIPARKATDVDALIASGEDLVDNFVHISHSLRNILTRVDRGEGLLGELTTQPASKQRLTDSLLATLNKTNRVLDSVDRGEGLAGRLINDKELADDLTGSLRSGAQSLRTILANVETGFTSGEGALPALLTDPEGKERIFALIDNLRTTADNFAAFSVTLRSGEGIIPRLLSDREFADSATAELNLLISELRQVAEKINRGEGTAGRLISDPAIYESVNDILIGINESSMLRWLIRNRQQRGIQTRYETATGEPAPEQAEEPTPAEPLPPAGSIPPEEPAAEPPAEEPPTGSGPQGEGSG